jgi:hypothetical protein
MPVITLEQIDAVPVQGNDLTFELQRWLSTLVDTLNTGLQTIQNELNLINQYVNNNGLTAPSYTTSEIATLASASPNGTFWYDLTANHIVAKVNGVVVTVI